MAVLLAEYRIGDLDTFRRVFDEFQAVRSEQGATGHRLLRSATDPDCVAVLFEFPTARAARDFAADPRRSEALVRASVSLHSDQVFEDLEVRAY